MWMCIYAYINVCACLTQIYTSLLVLSLEGRVGRHTRRTSLWLPHPSPERLQGTDRTLIPQNRQAIFRSRCPGQKASGSHQVCPQSHRITLDVECSSDRSGLICSDGHLSWKHVHSSGVSCEFPRELQSSLSMRSQRALYFTGRMRPLCGQCSTWQAGHTTKSLRKQGTSPCSAT